MSNARQFEEAHMAIKTVIDDGYFHKVYNTKDQMVSCRPKFKGEKLLNIQPEFFCTLYGNRIYTKNEQGDVVSSRWA